MSLANAIIYDRPDQVKALVEAGADINEIDEYGYTPLIEAAIANQTEIGRYLLGRGAKVNEPDLTGGRALHWSVDNDNIELTKILLQAGADPNVYTDYGQPALVKPLLRNHKAIKKLLYQYGASLDFAQDYISAKLLAHRFELTGRVYIAAPQKVFIEIDLEGFILEFTVAIVTDSLIHFRKNFAARDLKNYFKDLDQVIDSYKNAMKLLKYQHFMVNLNQYENQVRELMAKPLLLLPVAYAGHAVSFAFYQDYMLKIDRGAASKSAPSAAIYRINRQLLDLNFLKQMIYQKQTEEFVKQRIFQQLEAKLITSLAIPSQITGNCSWANVEAALPGMLLLLHIEELLKDAKALASAQQIYLDIWQRWEIWDKDLALDKAIKEFYRAGDERRATKASLLAMVMFQTCQSTDLQDLKRAEKIAPILTLPRYRYILKSYLKVYTQLMRSDGGNNLKRLLDILDLPIEWFHES